MEFYLTIYAKAATSLESIILNHPFVDGNKRTATVAAEFFLEINGNALFAPDKAFEDFAVHVAESGPSLNEIEAWISGFSRRCE